MFRYIIFSIFLFLTACATKDVSIQQNASAVPQKNTAKASFPLSVSSEKKPNAQITKKAFYDPKVASYIDQNEAVLVLRTTAPEFTHKILAPHCTIEKFVSGLNSSQTKIQKISSSMIEIKTTGSKIGNGSIIINTQGKNAEISSAVIGKFKKSDRDILRKFAQNICNTVDEKLK